MSYGDVGGLDLRAADDERSPVRELAHVRFDVCVMDLDVEDIRARRRAAND